MHTHRNAVEVEWGLVGGKKRISRVGRELGRTEDNKGVNMKCTLFMNENAIMKPIIVYN